MTTRCPRCAVPVSVTVDDVAVTIASDADRAAGLLAHVRVLVGGFLLDGLSVRRDEGGQLYLAWPRRRSRNGGYYPFALPIDPQMKLAIEARVDRAYREACK